MKDTCSNPLKLLCLIVSLFNANFYLVHMSFKVYPKYLTYVPPYSRKECLILMRNILLWGLLFSFCIGTWTTLHRSNTDESKVIFWFYLLKLSSTHCQIYFSVASNSNQMMFMVNTLQEAYSFFFFLEKISKSIYYDKAKGILECHHEHQLGRFLD